MIVREQEPLEALDEVLDDRIQAAPRPGLRLGALLLMLGLVLMMAVVGFALVRQNQVQPRSGPAPTFSLTTFDGSVFDLAAQRGQVVVVNFWGYWCGPCRDEAPLLQAVYEQYRERGVAMIGVTYLAPELDKTLAFLQEFGVTYPNGDDLRSRIADAYRITGAPETFVIDQEGEIARFYFGPITDGGSGPLSVNDLTATLDCLLAYSGTDADACIAGLEGSAS